MATMKQMRKFYRREHSARGKCPVCGGNDTTARFRKCCANGTVTVYPPSAPGLRSFARMQLPALHVGKLRSLMRMTG